MRDIPTALAPTAELAEPRIKRFAEKLARQIGASVHDFYACDPCTNRVYAGPLRDAPSWIAGDWGVELRCRAFSPHDLDSSTIAVELMQVMVHPEHGMIVTLRLSARVMR